MAEENWCTHLAPWVLRCHQEGTSPDSLALMAREACVPRFNGTAAKKQFFSGYALRGQCRRSTENSSPSFSRKMSISICYKLLPEDLAFFWWGGRPLKIFKLIIYLFLAMLGLHCCGSFSLAVVWRASHCDGFSRRGTQALGLVSFGSCGP